VKILIAASDLVFNRCQCPKQPPPWAERISIGPRRSYRMSRAC